MKIFVGNLAKEVTDDELSSEFLAYGKVKSDKIIRDLFSGESKGFGFVEMFTKAEAEKAISELNTKTLKGKKITVNEARPKVDGGRNRKGGSGSGGSSSGNSFNKGRGNFNRKW